MAQVSQNMPEYLKPVSWSAAEHSHRPEISEFKMLQIGRKILNYIPKSIKIIHNNNLLWKLRLPRHDYLHYLQQDLLKVEHGSASHAHKPMGSARATSLLLCVQHCYFQIKL